MIAKALDAAGLPAGVFNLVPGSGEAVGNRLVEDPRIKMVAFTGSTAVGKGIAAKASVLFKKYSLEMGGKNPLILLRDFDLDQRCVSPVSERFSTRVKSACAPPA